MTATFNMKTLAARLACCAALSFQIVFAQAAREATRVVPRL